MILEPSPPKAALTSSSVTRVASVDSPPAYTQPAVRSTETFAESLDAAFDKSRRERARRRKRFGLLALIAVIYTVAVVVFMTQKPWRQHWKSSAFYPPLQPFGPKPPLNDSDHVGFALMCNKWDFQTPDTSRLQSYFPLNTTHIFVNNSAGNWVSGTLHATLSKEAIPGYHIQVEVRPRFKGHAVDNNVRVCVLGGDTPGSYGVGIFDAHHAKKDDIDININVIVPPNRSLPTLSTYLPRFHQRIGQPGPNILNLGTVELGGPVEQLTMHSGAARNLIIEPASSFSGLLSVSETLHIKSLASSYINANVTLVQSGHPFNVQFDTVHAPIHALIQIENPSTAENPSEQPPSVQCYVTASTVSAPIHLEVAYDSPHVVLHVNASTKLAPLFIRVPPAYEGDFGLQALSSQATLHESTVRDPLNDERTRIVTFTTPNATSYLSGSVSWQDPITPRDVQPGAPPGAGTLQGRTLSAKALLKLGDLEQFADPATWPSGCVVP